MKLPDGVYYDEAIAWIALDVLGSYGLEDYTRGSIDETLSRFHSDYFDDPTEQAEIVDEVEKFIRLYGDELVNEIERGL